MCVVIIWRFFLKFDAFILAVHISRAPPIICVFIFCKTTVGRQHSGGRDGKVYDDKICDAESIISTVYYDAESPISTVSCDGGLFDVELIINAVKYDERKAYERNNGLFQVGIFVYSRV